MWMFLNVDVFTCPDKPAGFALLATSSESLLLIAHSFLVYFQLSIFLFIASLIFVRGFYVKTLDSLSLSLEGSSQLNMANKHFLTMSIFVIVGMLLIHVSNGELQRFERPTKADGSLSVLVVGDWGRKGDYNQSEVAYQMGIIGEKSDFDFVISTGDNFYPSGLRDVNDPAFDQSFTDVYKAPSLQKQWYSVLGNHDYRGDALAQSSPILKGKDNRWFCMKSYILNADIVEFFFIDTTPFQNKYFEDPEDNVYDWRGILPRNKYLFNLLQDLESTLRESHAKWKIVVGHHTIKSASVHGNTPELVQKLLPILEANGVDLYINGHDHCLEHISSSASPLQFLTSGAGSKAWRGDYNWAKPSEMKFFYDGQGFMSLQINLHEININFYDIFGNILHKWRTSKSLSAV